MTRDQLCQLLEEVARGQIDADAALRRLERLPFEDIGFARVDHHRALRCGFPEVIFGTGKPPEQFAAIFERLAVAGSKVLATRVTAEQAQRVRERFADATYHELSRTLTLRSGRHEGTQARRHEREGRSDEGDGRTATAAAQGSGFRVQGSERSGEGGGTGIGDRGSGQEQSKIQNPKSKIDAGFVGIVCAGTSDLPVAEEARITAEMMDQPVRTFYDVGVAGLHRLLSQSTELRAASVLVVVAGMEGALPSVVGGLVEAPVIAVPTSVGYGASFGGLAALLAMLNSCAAGVSVVNIDNGFGAGYQAALINRLAARGAGEPALDAVASAVRSTS